jgi:hypothetical protein
MPVYTIERNEETKCFQQKYIYPGAEKWEQMKNHIAAFIKTRTYMYNGGWSIHHFLKSLDIGLQIYNEDDICDSTDFDMFGPYPVEDLIKLGESLRKEFPEMTFNINNGMHPNQYTIMINFLGTKLVDWIYISPKVYKYVPSITYSNGVTCLHPRVELMRQYNMLSNIYLMAPDKDFNKALKRIELLEKYAMIPWMKENNLWDARKLNSLLNQEVSKNTTNLNLHIDIQGLLLSKWLGMQKYVSKVGQCAFNEMYSKTNDKKHIQLEFVVHDAVFSKALTNLFQFMKQVCKDKDISFEKIVVVEHETFIGVIGPLYNGWVDFMMNGELICRLYSLSTPVHMYDIDRKLCSYFFNMAHMMWYILYLQYLGKKDMLQYYDVMVAYSFKKYLTNSSDKLYVLNMNKESSLGVIPSRNFYMMNNLLRKQGIGFFRYAIDYASEKKNKGKLDQADFFYKHYEGKIIFRTSLNKVNSNKLPELAYLYERMKSSNDDTKTSNATKKNKNNNNKAKPIKSQTGQENQGQNIDG